jgi:spore germination cell wall hydrolase CwlJ-like protein
MIKVMKVLIVILIIVLSISLVIGICLNSAYAKARTYTRAEKEIIARVEYAECLHQPVLGRYGVIQSVMNRLESGLYGKSLNRITRRSQYAKARSSLARKDKRGNYKDKHFARCMRDVEYVISHRLFPKNMYYFKRANRPYWRNTKAGRRIVRYCRIGAHTFYTYKSAKPVPGNVYVGKDGKLKVRYR